MIGMLSLLKLITTYINLINLVCTKSRYQVIWNKPLIFVIPCKMTYYLRQFFPQNKNLERREYSFWFMLFMFILSSKLCSLIFFGLLDEANYFFYKKICTVLFPNSHFFV